MRPSGYQFSDVGATSARVVDAIVMRLPPSTDIFKIVGRDTIDGELQIELCNTADVPVGAFGVVRWLRGGDLIDVDLAASGDTYSQTEAEDIDPGQRSTLNFGNDIRQGDSAYRATDYNLTLLTNNTFLSGYVDEESGETYIDITAPFSTDMT